MWGKIQISLHDSFYILAHETVQEQDIHVYDT